MYVSSANLGSAFQRMLTEPKSKQQNIKEYHKFVVINHMLSSYTATLMTTIQHANSIDIDSSHIKLIRKSLYILSDVIKKMNSPNFKELEITIADIKTEISQSSEDNLLYEQLELVHKLVLDIQKLNQNKIPDTFNSLEH